MGVTVVMVVVIMLCVIMSVVVVMRMIMVIVAAIRPVHVHIFSACSATRFATGNRLCHQPIFLGHGRCRGMLVLVRLMIVRMIVIMLMVIMTMAVVMAGHCAQTVSTTLGLERFHHEADLRAEFLDEFNQYIVIADAQSILKQLCGCVTVAQMPGDARNHMRIRRPELDETLRLPRDKHQIAGFKLKRIAFKQRRSVSQIDMKFGALGSGEGCPTPATIFKVQFDGVNGPRRIKTAGFQSF